MKIRKEHLDCAERANVLPPGGAASLWGNLSQQVAQEPAFRFQHLLYYFGAMLMLLPFSVFAASGRLNVGNAGLLAIALLVGVSTFLAAERLLASGHRIAAGAVSVTSLALVPLAAYALLSLLGVDLSTLPFGSYDAFHRNISMKYISIEAVTLAASVFYLRRHRLPFLMLPVSVTLWYLGLDLSSQLVGGGYARTIDGWSTAYGLCMMVFAFLVDYRTRHTLSDYSFWPWLFGTFSFWGALSLMYSDNEWSAFGYLLVNLALIVGSILVRRRVLLVAGALGSAGYLGHLCFDVFKDSPAFPFVTLLAGAILIGFGLRWPTIARGIAKALGVPMRQAVE